MSMRPVVTVRRPNHAFRQEPIHQLTIDHPDLAHVCGHLFEDNRICVLAEDAHASPSERERDAEKLRLAGLALEQILTSGDLETIHALASNTLRHLREMP